MDIVDRLKRWAALKTGDKPEFADKMNWGEDLNADLIAAIEEIEHLRSLAGAVTPGPTAAETFAPLRHKAPDLQQAIGTATSYG